MTDFRFHPRRPHRFLLLALALAWVPARAQDSPRKAGGPPAKAPTAELVRHGWSGAGELVLAVAIRPGPGRLELGRLEGSAAADGRGEKLLPFSMGESVLVDLYTQKEIRALARLPKKPFFGTMEGMVLLEPGDSLTFGVAFPRPPDPPKGPDGIQKPYRFLLRPPAGIAPVEMVIPFG